MCLILFCVDIAALKRNIHIHTEEVRKYLSFSVTKKSDKYRERTDFDNDNIIMDIANCLLSHLKVSLCMLFNHNSRIMCFKPFFLFS